MPLQSDLTDGFIAKNEDMLRRIPASMPLQVMGLLGALM